MLKRLQIPEHFLKSNSAMPGAEHYNDFINRMAEFDQNLSVAIAAKSLVVHSADERLVSLLNQTHEANAYMNIVSLGKDALILNLWKMLEPAGRDRCSYDQLLKMANREELYPFTQHFVSKHNGDLEQSLDYKAFLEAYKTFRLENAELIKRIRHHRNRYIAHSLALKEKAPAALTDSDLGDLFRILDDLCALFETFTGCIKGSVVINDSKNEVWDLYTKRLIERII